MIWLVGASNMNSKIRHAMDKLTNNSPSKWGGGVGLLWRGNSAAQYFCALKRVMFSGRQDISPAKDMFLFESSRVGIYQFAKFVGLSAVDRVQVLGFTCDAVTDAIKPFGSKITLYDCDKGLRCQNFVLEQDTKLLICQVTFGVCALSNEILALAESKGVHILIDKSLSYGAKDFDDTAMLRYPQVLSFEVSKSFTIGWGGMLRVPESMTSKFKPYFDELGEVTFADDLGRVLRVWLNLFMARRGGKWSYGLWLVLRVAGLHRLSVESSSSKYHHRSKIGPLSKSIFSSLMQGIPLALGLSNQRHEALKNELVRQGYHVISDVDESLSTPRVAFLLDENRRAEFYQFFAERHVEVGFWFDRLALPDSEVEEADLSGCRALIKSVVNLPCHWTLTAKELDQMILCIRNFSSKTIVDSSN